MHGQKNIKLFKFHENPSSWIAVVADGQTDMTRLKVRPHRTRSAAADCGLCPLRNVTF